MDFRETLIGPCAEAPEIDRDSVTVDFPAIVARLLLFDNYILQSIRLLEFPHFVNVFGLSGVFDLLSSKLLKIHCDIATFAQIGHLVPEIASRREKGVLPLGSYSFSPVRAGRREHYVHQLFQNLQPRLPLATKDIIKLKRAILASFIETPAGFGEETLIQTKLDMRSGNVDILKNLLAKALYDMHGKSVSAHELEIRIHSIDEEDFRVETNVGLHGLDERAAHKTVERALLALFGLNQPIEEMKAYNAISGCIDDESPFFMDRLGFLLRGMRPQGSEENFQRVVNIGGFPEFLPRIDKIDAKRLLSIRETAELIEFRAWLRSSAHFSDEEIADRVGCIRGRLGDLLSSGPMKGLRFVATTGVGLAATIPGLVVGALDSFLVDRIFPRSGVWTFVNRLYPSIFKRGGA